LYGNEIDPPMRNGDKKLVDTLKGLVGKTKSLGTTISQKPTRRSS
jgi:hypothetical protein